MSFVHNPVRMSCKLAGVVAVLLGLSACNTVPYNPATTGDTTKPNVALHIENANPNPVEVTNFVPGSPQNKRAVANPAASLNLLATAGDNESGIKDIKLSVTRTVKFIASNGALTEAYFGTKEVDSKTYTLTNGQAPTLGAIQLNVVPRDQFVFTNANGGTTTGVGVILDYNVEAHNQNGQWDYTDRLVIVSGQVQ